tara:strand:+ start:505 stop:1461 length:957 start_codon:yes stop_codon:yes gene_type:complete
MQRALIIGCTGQDGSFLTKSLLEKGFEVVGTTRKTETYVENHNLLGISKDIDLRTLDTCDFDSLKDLISKIAPEEIYYLAAQSSVGESFKYPGATIKSICMGTATLLEAYKNSGIDSRLFFAGSGEIFGETKGKASLNYPFQPMNPYAISKITSQNLVDLYRNLYGIQACTGILFNHESELRTNNFVTQKIINGAVKAAHDKNFKLNLGNIDIVRDWGLAEEYIEAMQLILKNDVIKNHIICSGFKLSLKKFIEIAFRKVGLNWQDHININNNLIRPSDIKQNIGDPKNIFRDLGWKAKTYGENLVDRLINYQLSRKV